MKKLSIIILSYNVKKKLIDCLASIPKHKDWEIIIPDNGSTDGSLEEIPGAFSTGDNLGFAAGNNVGIHRSQGKFVLLLNPDTIVYPKTIETILDYMEKHKDVGAATCRVELPDGNLDYSCHRNFPDPISSFLHLVSLKRLSSYTNQKLPNSIHEIDALTGAFAMIRREAGEQVGWLDEDYYWNGEDIDFCYKLKAKGWKVMYIPSVKITHFKGSSVRATAAGRHIWAINSTQAMRIFYQKHLATKYPFFINWMVYLGIWLLEKMRIIRA